MKASEDRPSKSDDVDIDTEFEELDDDFEIEEDPDTTPSNDVGYGAGDEQDEEFIVEEEDEQPTDVIKKLRDRLKDCTAQKQEYLDGWQRAKADMINTKKEFVKERERTKDRAVEGVIADILPVLDSFEMAFSNQKAWNSIDEQWRSGVEQIHAQLTNALRSNGVEAITPEAGDEFSPQLHTSVDTTEAEDEDKVDTVAACEKTGYRIGDRVIRSANVVVFKEAESDK